MGYNHYSQTFAQSESRCRRINVILNKFSMTRQGDYGRITFNKSIRKPGGGSYYAG